MLSHLAQKIIKTFLLQQKRQSPLTHKELVENTLTLNNVTFPSFRLELWYVAFKFVKFQVCCSARIRENMFKCHLLMSKTEMVHFSNIRYGLSVYELKRLHLQRPHISENLNTHALYKYLWMAPHCIDVIHWELYESLSKFKQNCLARNADRRLMHLQWRPDRDGQCRPN